MGDTKPTDETERGRICQHPTVHTEETVRIRSEKPALISKRIPKFVSMAENIKEEKDTEQQEEP